MENFLNDVHVLSHINLLHKYPDVICLECKFVTVFMYPLNENLHIAFDFQGASFNGVFTSSLECIFDNVFIDANIYDVLNNMKLHTGWYIHSFHLSNRITDIYLYGQFAEGSLCFAYAAFLLRTYPYLSININTWNEVKLYHMNLDTFFQDYASQVTINRTFSTRYGFYLLFPLFAKYIEIN